MSEEGSKEQAAPVEQAVGQKAPNIMFDKDTSADMGSNPSGINDTIGGDPVEQGLSKGLKLSGVAGERVETPETPDVSPNADVPVDAQLNTEGSSPSVPNNQESEESEEETEEETEEGEEETEDDDRVEITEFVISVDDVQAAIAELAELGIDAAEVGLDDSSEFDMEASDDLDGEEEMDDLGSEEETDEMGDFDLDIEGELGGEDETGNELEEAEVEDELTSDDDEFTMGDLDSSEGDDLGGDVEGEMDDLSGEDEMADDLGGEEAPVVAGGSQIKVSADNWEKLKGWLESKGVDIEEMFGGQIETEGGEEGIEDEINFDQLEEMPDDESKKHEESESEEEAEEQEEGDDEKGEEKPNGGFEPGKKGVNPFPKK